MSRKSDVLSRKSRDDIILRLNPLQDIRAHLGIKNKTSYGADYIDIEIDGSGGTNSAGSSDKVSQFSIATISSDTFISTDGTTVAFPNGLRAGSNPKGDFTKAQIVPGLKVGMTVFAANVGESVTGITGVEWLWLNNEGMSWGLLFRFKDSSNNCAPMRCFVCMTDPVPDV